MMRSALIGLTLLCAQTAAHAQSVTLTVDDGRALVVGGPQTLGDGLTPTTLDGSAIVSEFQRLCLPNPDGASSRVAESPFRFSPADAVFAPSGKQGEARVAQWRGPSALLSVWTGDDANLKNRPIAMPSRGAVTTGPYGPFRADGAQCNLVVALDGFSSVVAITDALTAAFGNPGKLVAKKSFADGYWLTAGTADPIRININAPTTRGGPQPVHLSAQIMKKGRKR